MKSDSNVDLEAQLTYAWNYFAVHAEQRMHLFNFFVGLAVVLTGAVVGTFHKDFKMPEMGVVLGLGLAVVSFIFWKLDQRVGYLVKLAELALAELEGKFSDASSEKPSARQLVLAERNATRELRETRKRWAPLSQYSYSQSFRIVFGFFGLVGILGAALSLSL